MNNSRANHEMSKDIYRKLQELVKKYGIDFIADDQFVEAFIEHALYNRQEFNKDLSTQEIFDSVRIDLCRGLTYILKLIIWILDKKSSLRTRIIYKNYYMNKVGDHNDLCLDFNEVQANIGISLDGVIISWRIVPRQYQNLEKWRYIWLMHEVSQQSLANMVKQDISWIKEKLLEI